jgi:alpha-L-rhamnosidase
MFRKIPSIAVFLFCIGQLLGGQGISPVALRSEYLVNPEGMDVLSPRLSWELESEERGQRQAAYRVLVASSPELLEKNRGDLWDTGKVSSDQTNQLAYRGKPLRSQMRCFWKVKVWPALSEAEGADVGKPSEWSAIARWSMGLLQASDWQAEWIGLDSAPKDKPKSRAALDGKNPRIIIQKASYGVRNDPKRQMDLTEILQKHVDAGNLLLRPNNKFAGRDPAYEVKKHLLVECTVDGRHLKNVAIPENEEWDLSIGQKSKVYLPAPYLRKEFRVRAPVRRAVVYATAQGIFELSLNGRRVGNEYFMPGWTDYRKRIYYRAYDVTDMLETGSNALGAILGDGWFRGNISVSGQNQYGTRLRFKGQLHIEYADGQTEIIASDRSWRAAYGPILESDMQAGEVYDARREMPGWNRAGFDAKDWSPVVAGSSLNPLLEAYPGAPVRNTLELPTLDLTEPAPGKYVFDLGQNFSGWIRLKVKGNAGDRLVLHFGEMLEADGTVYTANLRSARATDTYILKGGGEEIWEPRFTFHGFRYVQISGLRNKPTTDAVTGIVIHSDAPLSASFECSNPMLNQLYRNIVWGQRSNYLEVPTDCPQRDERLGWTGDTQVFIRTGCYNQDVSAFFTKWIVDLMDTQNAHGLFGNQAPVFHGHGAAAWACAGIISPWTIYKVYGDIRVIRDNYDSMVRYLEACGKDGLGGRKAHTWGDWLAPGRRPPPALVSAAYYAYTTSLMAEIAEVLGKESDAARYRKQFEAIRTHFQKTFVGNDGRIESDLQTVYCMALKYKLLTEAQREQAAAHLVKRIQAKNYHLSVGFLGMPILLPTLTDIGRSDLAYRLIQNTTYPSWGYSIEQGATTIWERWNSFSKKNGFGDVKMNSFNHYALGSCGEWMFRSLLGIESDGAGFRKIEMNPEMGEGITWSRGHYDSINGRIGSDWKIVDGKFIWRVVVPANTSATVYVPAEKIEAVSLNGQPGNTSAPAELLRMEHDRAVFKVGSGTYEFVSKQNIK